MYEGTGRSKHIVSRLALGAQKAAVAGRDAPTSADGADALAMVAPPGTLWTSSPDDVVPAAIRAAQRCGRCVCC